MTGQEKIIDDFVTMLNKSIMNTIEQNISFESLSDARKILVLQSAPISIVEKAIRRLTQLNEDVEYVIMGNDKCVDISRSIPTLKVSYVSHNKSFDGADVEIVRKIMEEENIDAILFFNNFVNSVDFSNVEHLISFVKDRVMVYGYSYVQQELNKYRDITSHMYGEIAYKAIVEWYEKSGEWRGKK